MRYLAAVVVMALFPSLSEARQVDRFCNVNNGQYNIDLSRNLQLRREGTRFTVGGNATFLTSISLFGANRYTPTDAANIFKLACSYGFNTVRIFADYWDDVPNCSGNVFPYVAAAYRVIQPNGGALGPGAGNLAQILIEARKAGLVVDLSFGAELVGGRTISDMVAGIRDVAAYMSAYPTLFNHVMLDVQNEYDNFVPNSQGQNHPCYHPVQATSLSLSQRQSLISAGKTGDSARVVFMSSGAAPNAYGGLADSIAAGGVLVAAHEFRSYPPGYSWWSPSFAQSLVNVSNQYGYSNPIYLQEPDRWMSPAYGPCILDQDALVESACELTAGILLGNGNSALEYGAAGWTFHTESFFYPHKPQLRPFSLVELAVAQGLRSSLVGSWGSLSPNWLHP